MILFSIFYYLIASNFPALIFSVRSSSEDCSSKEDIDPEKNKKETNEICKKLRKGNDNHPKK